MVIFFLIKIKTRNVAIQNSLFHLLLAAVTVRCCSLSLVHAKHSVFKMSNIHTSGDVLNITTIYSILSTNDSFVYIYNFNVSKKVTYISQGGAGIGAENRAERNVVRNEN